MDTIGGALPNNSNIVSIVSEGYEKEIIVDLSSLDEIPQNEGTLSLVAGMMKATRNLGFKVSGFNAYVSTNVISSPGVSSSVSFEMLICFIIMSIVPKAETSNYIKFISKFVNQNNIYPMQIRKFGSISRLPWYEKC